MNLLKRFLIELAAVVLFVLFWSTFTLALIAAIPVCLILIVLLELYEFGEDVFKEWGDL